MGGQSAVVGVDGGGVPAQGGDLDLHIGVERQLQQGIVQRLGIGHVEDADVGVEPAIRQRWRQVPWRCSSWASSFSACLSRVASAAGSRGAVLTVMRT